MRRWIALLIFLTVSVNTKAQLRHCIDSIRYDLKQKRSWFLSLDGKNSVVSDLNFKLFGLQFGYLYNKRTNLFVGFYTNTQPVVRISENPTALNGGRDSNTVYDRYSITYFNAGCEYYFHNSKKWRFSIPVSLGIGLGNNQLTRNGKILKQKSSTILPLEFGATAYYKIKWWIWAGAGLGQRVAIGDSKYSGPYFTIGLSIRYGEIYNRVEKWYKKTF